MVYTLPALKTIIASDDMRQDIRIAIGLVFVGLLGALLLCEAGVRCWKHWHPIRAVRSDRPWYYYAADDVKRVKNFPFSEEKPSGVFRIAVVGDSFSYPTHSSIWMMFMSGVLKEF